MIATLKTTNRKTGPMVQTWILRTDRSPLDAIRSGADSAICGDCPHRGSGDSPRTCYVDVAKAPLSIYRAFHRGRYPRLPSIHWPATFGDRLVRLGAYGDPAAVPTDVLRALTRVSKGWTGYTHQWRSRPSLRHLCMASVDSEAERDEAHRKGWRTFRVAPIGEKLVTDAEVPCPSDRVSCSACRLCRGASTTARSIAITAHGINGSKVR